MRLSDNSNSEFVSIKVILNTEEWCSTNSIKYVLPKKKCFRTDTFMCHGLKMLSDVTLCDCISVLCCYCYT
jgi:hypothetical protein